MHDASLEGLDRAMLAFGQSWCGYGGGSDEDIYVTFGMPSDRYFERLVELLDSSAALTMDESTRADIRAVCERRLRRL